MYVRTNTQQTTPKYKPKTLESASLLLFPGTQLRKSVFVHPLSPKCAERTDPPKGLVKSFINRKNLTQCFLVPKKSTRPQITITIISLLAFPPQLGSINTDNTSHWKSWS